MRLPCVVSTFFGLREHAVPQLPTDSSCIFLLAWSRCHHRGQSRQAEDHSVLCHHRSSTGLSWSAVCAVSSTLGGNLSAWMSQHYTDSGARMFCPQPPPGPGMDKQPFRANESWTIQLTHWMGHAPGWDRQHRKCEKQALLPLATKQRKPAWLLLPV